MATKIFVNLPVKDLKASIAFFTQLGYSFNPQFTDETATCMIISEDIYAMLMTHEKFKTFTPKEICDATKSVEMLLCLSCESREQVDELVRKALAAGGSTNQEAPHFCSSPAATGSGLMRHQTAKPWLADRLRLAAIMLVTGMAIVGGGIVLAGPQPEEARVLPAPQVDEPAGTAPAETAVVAGGCFWGVQGVFQHTEGVLNAVSGYAGGDKGDADYDKVSMGTTRHAEAVRIAYDPAKISYGRILQIYFSVAHDPTELNRQGPDVGPQYRSTIFPQDAEQERVAKAYIAQLDKARVYRKAIATTIEPSRSFYAAEDYHQDFMTKNPMHPYIMFHDAPKIANLQKMFPQVFRAKPVLVANASAAN